MPQIIDVPEDILPEGHPDPMLMGMDDLANSATDLAGQGNPVASGFLLGILHARTAIKAAGIHIS